MQTDIEFQLNDLVYFAAEYSGGFGWSNNRGEESSRFHATLLEAQQHAIDWESGRRERVLAAAEEAEDAECVRKEQQQFKYGNCL